MRAHARWDDLSTYAQPGAWLRRVMSNLLIDHHRSAEAEDPNTSVLVVGDEQTEITHLGFDALTFTLPELPELS